MEMVGLSVKHKKFGNGNVLDCHDGKMNVKFSGGIKQFQYPLAFVKFLEAEDCDIQTSLYEFAVETSKRLAEQKTQYNTKQYENPGDFIFEHDLSISEFGIENGMQLREFLTRFIPMRTLSEANEKSIVTSENVLHLERFLATFNLKGNPGKRYVRFNCKKDFAQILGLDTFKNGVGDPTHPCSKTMETVNELLDLVEKIKRV